MTSRYDLLVTLAAELYCGFLGFFLVLLIGNIRTHIRDQTGFESMSSLQESINCIGTSSGLTFPHRQRLSSKSSFMTSRFVSVGRAGDPWTLPTSRVGVHVKDHTRCMAEWQAAEPVKCMF